MGFDRQKIFLGFLKYVSYVINFLIVAAIAAFVIWYALGLFGVTNEQVHYFR